MRSSQRYQVQQPVRRLLAVVVVAALAASAAVGMRYVPGISVAMSRLDDVLYDAMYRLRPLEDRKGGDVVIITLDDGSLAALGNQGVYWPVQRDWWGMTLALLEKCGAKVVAFDIVFPEPSVYRQFVDDDQQFAQALDSAKVPVVMGVMAEPAAKPSADGSRAAPPGPFAVPVQRPPVYGAVNVVNDKLVRDFRPTVNGLPSLASQVASASGAPPRDWASKTFRLHYYGPHAGPDRRPLTYRYVPAEGVFAAARKLQRGKPLDACGIDPSLFRGKVVLIGYTAALLYDLKSSPLSDIAPGVEIQATAVDNLLHDQRVLSAGGGTSAAATFGGALLAAMAVAFPRRAALKLTGAAAAVAGVILIALALFVGREIRWLPLSAPLLAWLLATIASFAWSYFTEGRHRRRIVRAFSQVLSPDLVAEIERDPHQLDPGGERREMTVMFTDLAGFTTLTERMENHDLVALLNFYFEQMAPLILEGRGTLDKYIGDAIMSFWNAPVPQPDHAALACRTALRLAERERQIQPELVRRGAERLLTRIGINTGPMIVGFTGSGERLNYSVLGDSVNFGSRLEGANKIYGSQILISESTANCVKDRFLVRQLDVLRVKGKHQPMAVYELMADAPGDERQRRLATLYQAALDAYRQQRWDDAEGHLAELIKDYPDDGPGAALQRRVAKLTSNPPMPDWDGVFVAEEK